MKNKFTKPPPDDAHFRTWDYFRAASIAVLTGLEPSTELSGDLLTFVFPKTPDVIEASRSLSTGEAEGNLLQYMTACKRFYRQIRESKSAGR